MAASLICVAERLRRARAFVFDYYGTLAKDAVLVPPMWEHLTELGYRSDPQLQAAFEPDAFDGCTTPSLGSEPGHEEWNRRNLRQFVRLSGVPEHLVNGTLAILLERQAEFRARAAPSTRGLLDFLRDRGVKIALCSNWEAPIGPYLEQIGLSESDFDAITISAEVGARKPHAAIFGDVCSKLEVEPEQAAFVGDNWSSDIVGALRVGMTPLWLRQRRASRGLGHLVAEFDTLTDLLVYLERSL